MPKCLRPIAIPLKSYLRDHPQRLQPFMDLQHKYKEFRPYVNDSIFVPCGKCANCLKNKQACSTLRCQSEAIKRGSMTFVTLTYDDEHLPLSQSLWRESLLDGSQERIGYPELVYNSRSLDYSDVVELVKANLKNTREAGFPRYFDLPISGFDGVDPGYRYFARITPSISREDVRLWLKRSRMKYEREFGRKLPDFSYTLASEYGGRFCRPHYHICFFGLPLKDVYYLCNEWKFGFTQYKDVPRFNADGTDAYACSARYISKYINKGSFECDSVKCGAAEKPRVCQSKGFGTGVLSESIKDYILCFDLFGRYDADTLRFPTGKPLTEDQINQLVVEIPKRLTITLDGKYKYPLPRFVRESVFFHRFRTVSRGHKDGKPCVSYEVSSRPVKLWTLVQAFISACDYEVRNREFCEFLACEPARSLTEACLEFKIYSEKMVSSAEDAAEKSLISFYQKSKF